MISVVFIFEWWNRAVNRFTENIHDTFLEPTSVHCQMYQMWDLTTPFWNLILTANLRILVNLLKTTGCYLTHVAFNKGSTVKSNLCKVLKTTCCKSSPNTMDHSSYIKSNLCWRLSVTYIPNPNPGSTTTKGVSGSAMHECTTSTCRYWTPLNTSGFITSPTTCTMYWKKIL